MSAIPPEVRDNTVQSLIAIGTPISEAHEIADLCAHAVDEALAAIDTVTSRGSSFAVQMQAKSLAMQMAAPVFKAHADCLVQAVQSVAEKFGLPSLRINLGVEPEEIGKEST